MRSIDRLAEWARDPEDRRRGVARGVPVRNWLWGKLEDLAWWLEIERVRRRMRKTARLIT